MRLFSSRIKINRLYRKQFMHFTQTEILTKRLHSIKVKLLNLHIRILASLQKKNYFLSFATQTQILSLFYERIWILNASSLYPQKRSHNGPQTKLIHYEFTCFVFFSFHIRITSYCLRFNENKFIKMIFLQNFHDFHMIAYKSI